MKLIYIGPHSGGVDVPLPTGGEVTCRHGDPVDIPDSLGVRLLEQPTNWQRPTGKVTKPDVKKGDTEGEAV